MRHIGRLDSEGHARRFANYLYAQNVGVQIEEDDNQWAIWVLEEDAVATARTELAAFRETPEAAKYVDAQAVAARKRDQQLAEEKRAARHRVVDVRTQWDRPLTSRIPVTLLLVAGCMVVAMGTGFGSDKAKSVIRKIQINSYTTFIGPDGKEYVKIPPTFRDIKSGEVWRLITPIFVHYGVIHFAFGCYVVFLFGSQIETRRGTRRFLALVLILAVLPNVGQYLWSGPMFGGMSGVNYGLFGYAWMKTRFQPELGIYVDQSTVMMLMVWFFLCTTGFVGPIANAAHAVGLLTGIAIGYAPILLRRLGG